MTAKSIADILDAAADLITPEGAWTQGTWARNERGAAEMPWGPFATCFCIRGAIVRAGRLSLSDDLTSVNRALGFHTAARMARWNDEEGRTQAEAVSRLRSAADALRTSTPEEA